MRIVLESVTLCPAITAPGAHGQSAPRAARCAPHGGHQDRPRARRPGSGRGADSSAHDTAHRAGRAVAIFHAALSATDGSLSLSRSGQGEREEDEGGGEQQVLYSVGSRIWCTGRKPGFEGSRSVRAMVPGLAREVGIAIP